MQNNFHFDHIYQGCPYFGRDCMYENTCVCVCVCISFLFIFISVVIYYSNTLLVARAETLQLLK